MTSQNLAFIYPIYLCFINIWENQQVGVKKHNKFVGVGLGIRLDKNQYFMFKTSPSPVVFIFTHLLMKCPRQ